jgi:peptide/nickel transport system permease protein
MLIIGLTGWVGIARFTRNEFLKIRSLDYVTAALALGVSNRKIMFRHILPNALAPVMVSIVLGVAGAILLESSLSFLGIGVPADTVTWGSILNEARSNTFAWWLAVFPGFAIFITVLAYYLVGEGLRDALDPRLRGLR